MRWFLGALVVLVAFMVVAWAHLPAELTYLRGTRPAAESFEHDCPVDEPGLRNCETVTSYRWRLAGGASSDTTFQTSRDDVAAVIGELTLAGCPQARVVWELFFAERVAGGELSEEDRSVGLDEPVPEPLTEVRFTLWRTDSADCLAEFRWDAPELELPLFSLPV